MYGAKLEPVAKSNKEPVPAYPSSLYEELAGQIGDMFKCCVQ